MFSERLQVLLSKEQRRRLEAEAKRRHSSVGALIREAIDSRGGGATLEERSRAIAEIKDMRGGRFLPPGELERVIDRERERLPSRARGRR
jgi:predicted transcriptional regulator